MKSSGGKLIPSDDSKKKRWLKLLEYYESKNLKLRVSIEVIDKNINNNQISLYNSFVLKSSEFFGYTFKEMENILKEFYPFDIYGNKKSIEFWNNEELTVFLEKANSKLKDFNNNFEF